MTLQRADRVWETTATTGTGAYVLAGARTGFLAFSAVCANNDTAEYTATDGTNWEVGLGTWTTGGNLARTTIYASSNSGSAVSWGAGSKDIFLDLPAKYFSSPTSAAQEPAHTGDVTNSAGSLAMTLAATTNSTLTTLSSLNSVGTITTGTWSAGAVTASGNITSVSNTQGYITSNTYSSSNQSVIDGHRWRGSQGSPTTLVAGDVIVDFRAWGYDGANIQNSVLMRFSADSGGTISAGVVPGMWTLWTANASGSLTTALTVDRNQKLSIAGATTFAGVSTTASAANAYLDNSNSNNLLRSTSSIRYKTDVQDLSLDYAEQIVDELRPITYISKADADDKTVRWFGFIAEEVESVAPRLVSYSNDADGNLVADGVQYERISVALIASLKALKKKVAARDAIIAQMQDDIISLKIAVEALQAKGA